MPKSGQTNSLSNKITLQVSQKYEPGKFDLVYFLTWTTFPEEIAFAFSKGTAAKVVKILDTL